MNSDEIGIILDKHKKWLRGDNNGRRADLREADLRVANLEGADLREAILNGANLGGAYLRGANLGGAYLRRASLGWANLGGADLLGANLEGANLGGADLRRANLRGADLGGANLGGAGLGGAYLEGADLRRANIEGADLSGAYLESTEIVSFGLGKHFGFAHFGSQYDGGSYVMIGCEEHSLGFWLENYKEIGNNNGYSKEDIKRYGRMLKLLKKEIKEKNHE